MQNKAAQDRQREYERLKKECHDFIQTVYQHQPRIMVFGEGNLFARVMLVGEAPGAEETLQQRPFVGKAGRNLDDFLEAASICREQLYVTNVVKFRPVKQNERTGRLSNRPPKREEIDLLLPFLHREIALVQPDVVVSLGNVALGALLRARGAAIGKFHGTPQALGDTSAPQRVLFPLYHPASVIYNPRLRETYREDLRAFAAWLRDHAIFPEAPKDR